MSTPTPTPDPAADAKEVERVTQMLSGLLPNMTPDALRQLGPRVAAKMAENRNNST